MNREERPMEFGEISSILVSLIAVRPELSFPGRKAIEAFKNNKVFEGVFYAACLSTMCTKEVSDLIFSCVQKLDMTKA